MHTHDNGALGRRSRQPVHVLGSRTFFRNQIDGSGVASKWTMPKSTVPAASDGWVILPGLFEAAEIHGDDALEIRATALVLAQGKTYFVVYARERTIGAIEPAEMRASRPAA